MVTSLGKLAVDRLPLPEDDPKQRQPDIALAMRELGWKPVVQVKEGLGKTIEDFRSRFAGGRET